MDYSHFAILLLLVSLALLVAEVFVPSGGIISVVMLVALAGSVFCAFRAWWDASPGLWWGYVASVAVLLPAVLVAAFTVFPRTAYGRRILLDAPAPEEIAPFVREQAELRQLIGRRAQTVTLHGPGGIVTVDGRRYHSETRGMLLDPGEEVEIVAIKGNRLVIRFADALPPPPDPIAPLAATEPLVPEQPSGDEPASAEPLDPFLDDTRKT